MFVCFDHFFLAKKEEEEIAVRMQNIVFLSRT